ncbi:SpoIIE family protein phosphatase [Streptomyces sp. NPDC048288]|uniref:SpoIIE family protein phosphatase n=1 Tax=Streptomyces sp. NPDC048288 TaxID=3365529 RepID=UPI003721DFBA
MTVKWDDTEALSHAHDRFLGERPVGGSVRASVLRSWQRSRSRGVAADHIDVVYHQDLDFGGLLDQLAGPVLDELASRVSGIRVCIALCDEQARVLARRVGEPSLNGFLDTIQLAPGFGFPEPGVGTNGMGTALAARRPSFICGREHYADIMRPFACAATPIRDPLSGRILGALDLTCDHKDAEVSMLDLVSATAEIIEQRLLGQIRSRERALLSAFLRARRQAGTGEDWSGEPVTIGLLPDDLLEQRDRILLLERAAEMISTGRTSLAEAQLAHGRVALLLSRQVHSLTGVTGLAVEAVLPDGTLRRLDSTARRSTETIIESADGSVPRDAQTVLPPLRRATPARRPPPSAPPATTRWLVAVGEAGVGRLALLSRQRLSLLTEAGCRIGSTLDVTHTAEELTEVVVPKFADFAAVDLPDAVLAGEEPPGPSEPTRRVALRGVHPNSSLHEVGTLITPSPATPQAISLTTEESVLEPDLNAAPGWTAQDPGRAARIREAGIHSLITVPLRARGAVLGVVSFYRSRQPGPFQGDDLSLAEELVSRAAVCIDNARRYTREHSAALALQTSLLLHELPQQNAVEVAHRYLPARGGASGDWFDVIPLSGARVALVVGDVVGRGVRASATMGRLCTAVRNFSDLDLPTDEVLAHLDDLVARLDSEQEGRGRAGEVIAGATCMYAVYDPACRRLTMANAGNPAPVLIRPDGAVDCAEVPTGPPLGLGGGPFETIDMHLDEGSELVLFTNGLLRDRSWDADTMLTAMREALAGPARTPEQVCHTLLETLLPAGPQDDVALLVARTRALDDKQVAQWDLPVDPAAVSGLRSAVTGQLAEWGLQELAFTTELAVSELATNAIRYGGAPIQVRLLRDRALICEVTDGSSTSPRLRRAKNTDEGGRGLFLVAQLTNRWGTRYTGDGKVIWAEQPYP